MENKKVINTYYDANLKKINKLKKNKILNNFKEILSKIIKYPNNLHYMISFLKKLLEENYNNYKIVLNLLLNNLDKEVILISFFIILKINKEFKNYLLYKNFEFFDLIKNELENEYKIINNNYNKLIWDKNRENLIFNNNLENQINLIISNNKYENYELKKNINLFNSKVPLLDIPSNDFENNIFNRSTRRIEYSEKKNSFSSNSQRFTIQNSYDSDLKRNLLNINKINNFNDNNKINNNISYLNSLKKFAYNIGQLYITRDIIHIIENKRNLQLDEIAKLSIKEEDTKKIESILDYSKLLKEDISLNNSIKIFQRNFFFNNNKNNDLQKKEIFKANFFKPNDIKYSWYLYYLYEFIKTQDKEDIDYYFIIKFIFILENKNIFEENIINLEDWNSYNKLFNIINNKRFVDSIKIINKKLNFDNYLENIELYDYFILNIYSSKNLITKILNYLNEFVDISHLNINFFYKKFYFESIKNKIKFNKNIKIKDDKYKNFEKIIKNIDYDKNEIKFFKLNVNKLNNIIKRKFDLLFTYFDLKNNDYLNQINLFISYLNLNLYNTESNIIIENLLEDYFKNILKIKHILLSLHNKDNLKVNNNKNNNYEKYPKNFLKENNKLICNFIEFLTSLISKVNSLKIIKLIFDCFIYDEEFIEFIEFISQSFLTNLNILIKNLNMNEIKIIRNVKIILNFHKSILIKSKYIFKNLEQDQFQIFKNIKQKIIYFLKTNNMLINNKDGIILEILNSFISLWSENDIQNYNLIILSIINLYSYLSINLKNNHLIDDKIKCFLIKNLFLNFVKLYSQISIDDIYKINQKIKNKEKNNLEKIELNVKCKELIYELLKKKVYILYIISKKRNKLISTVIENFKILNFFCKELDLEYEINEIRKRFLEIRKKSENKSKPKIITKTKDNKLNYKISDKFKIDIEKNLNLKLNDIPGLNVNSNKKGKLNKIIRKKTNNSINNNIPQLNITPIKKDNFNKNGDCLDFEDFINNDFFYFSQRKFRKIYENEELHVNVINLIFCLLINNELNCLNDRYCSEYPLDNGKYNYLFILHYHLNHSSNYNVSIKCTKKLNKGSSILAKLLIKNLNNFEIYKDFQKIANGAFGTVFKATTNLNNSEIKEVAIKVIDFKDNIYERSVIYSIFTEILILEKWKNEKYFCNMIDYGFNQNEYYIILYKHQQNLKEWRNSIKNNPFDYILKESLKIFNKIINGVEFLHNNNIIHFDLKAENILIDIDNNSDYHIYISDFGVSKLFKNEEDEYDFKSRGTEYIRSPEMLIYSSNDKKEENKLSRLEKKGINKLSDIWSLGCLLYELIGNEFLFYEDDWSKFYIRLTTNKLELLEKEKLKNIDNNIYLIDLLNYIWIKNPQFRPSISNLIDRFNHLYCILINQPLNSCSFIDDVIIKEEELFLFDKKFLIKQNNYSDSKKFQFDFMKLNKDISICSINYYNEYKNFLSNLGFVGLVNFNNKIKTNQRILNFNKEYFEYVEILPDIIDFIKKIKFYGGKILFLFNKNNALYTNEICLFCISLIENFDIFKLYFKIKSKNILYDLDLDIVNNLSKLFIFNKRKLIYINKNDYNILKCICGLVQIILKRGVLENKKIKECNCNIKNKSNLIKNCFSDGCENYLNFIKKRYKIILDNIQWICLKNKSFLIGPSINNNFKVLMNKFENNVLFTKGFINNTIEYIKNNNYWFSNKSSSSKIFMCENCYTWMYAKENEKIWIIKNNLNNDLY